MATVYDTLEIKNDGSAIWTQGTIKKTTETISSGWLKNVDTNTLFGAYTNGCTWFNGFKSAQCVCDKLKHSFSTSTEAGFNIFTNGANITVLKSSLETPDLQGFYKYLSNLNATFVGQASTPIVTTIPKELVPTILTQQTNILSGGSDVKPSSFKVTVPTTDGIKKEYTLTPINGWKGTAKANLLQTGDIELVLDLTIPSSFNASICSLATELKPKSERTVLGYNGNTPVVVKIGADGTVKLPVATTGTVKLDDTYKL